MAGSALSRVVRGRVMHKRHLPVENRFVYPVFFLLLNLDELGSLGSWMFGINRWRPLSLHFIDHADWTDPREWVKERLAQGGVTDCPGPVWLQTFPRVFGYVFNPVSFWYCQREDGSVGAIIAEVNNTFGDRHTYLLTPDQRTGDFTEVRVEKQLYVSPFYPVKGLYRFDFNCDLDAPRVRIDYFNQDCLQLNTAIWGVSRKLTTGNLLSVLMRQPLLTLGVMFHIHWQAFRLWRKRVTFFHRPTTTAREASS